MQVIIESKRDLGTYDWLLGQVEESAIQAACLSRAGNLRLYVSNLSKSLWIVPPEELTFAHREVALRHLEKIRKFLNLKVD